LFSREGWSDLFVETLYEYRPERFLIHGFVVMPDHFHLLFSPTQSLERAVQCVKGGFSFRVKKFLGWQHEVWTVGFSDHRVRDEEDFRMHERYIAKNAVELRLYPAAQEHPYCSAGGRYPLDGIPLGLKPGSVAGPYGAAEATPFQSSSTELQDPSPEPGKPAPDHALRNPAAISGRSLPKVSRNATQE
jgi:putative transposase